ncbi:MAG TPA: DUF397 domain-containing protein [Streptosporangiaceae bacterium]|nr:DUF397 domain-containing protein [Streptosporangiaceae bacterium]HVB45321.1 DUF397 domain-containing protein [Streptosporangiaceae bacterium]
MQQIPNGIPGDQGGPALVYTRAEITAFLAGVRNGEFDDLG